MESNSGHQWSLDDSWIIEMDPGVDGNARVMVKFDGAALCDDELMKLWQFTLEDGMAVGRPHAGWEYRKVEDGKVVGISVNPLPGKYAIALDKLDLYYQLTRLVTLNRGGRPVVGTSDGVPASLSDPVLRAADSHIRGVVMRDQIWTKFKDMQE